MSRKLWSINVIASELDRDRRTVTAALADVPADGTLKGNKGWFLDSAVRALARQGANNGETVPASRLLGHFVDRIVGFEELQASRSVDSPRGHVLSFKDAAAVMADGKPERLLTWLRAGMAYRTEGNWDTGDGFELVTSWCLDWQILIGREIRESGDRRAARVLDMVGALP